MSQGETVEGKTDIETALVNDRDTIRESERAKLLRVDDIAISDPLALLRLAIESVDRLQASTRSLKEYATQTTGDTVVCVKADAISDEAITIRVLVNRYEKERRQEMREMPDTREWETWA